MVKNNNNNNINNNINNYSRFLRVPVTSFWRPLKRMKKLDRMKIYALNTAETIQVLYYEYTILFYCCTLTQFIYLCISCQMLHFASNFCTQETIMMLY